MRHIWILFLAYIFSPTLHACERALVGTWESDGPATMSFNRNHAKLEERQDRFLESIVGMMTLEFTEEELHLHMPDTQVSVQGELKPFAGFEERKPYKVLFCSPRMAVIEADEIIGGDKDATTYFLVGPNAMWTYIGTNDPKIPDLHIREYFKRVQ